MAKIKKIVKEIIGTYEALCCIFKGVRSGLGINKLIFKNNNECVILGNGPSLKEILLESIDFLKGKKIFCVNDFAHSCYFEKIKPDYYVFFDPAYWISTASASIKELNLKSFKIMKEKVTWEMIIFMPISAKKWNFFMDLPKLNKNIEICYVNDTKIASSSRWRYFLYKNNLVMPLIQNVLVGAVFISLNMKFQKIYLAGADHSWHESIAHEDTSNILYWKNPHFSDEAKSHLEPVFKNAECTETFKMHEILMALSRMFEGYVEIEKYSKYLGVKIYNASKKSYIDAFERYNI